MGDGPGLPRGKWSRLPGEGLAPIGHNLGPPLDAGRSWRTHAWKTARAALLPKLPLEIIRRRVARAKELGLAYPQYASILPGSGRDIVAFLFTSDALGLRLARTVDLPETRARTLRDLVRCERLLLAETGDDAAWIRSELARGNRLPLAGAGSAPPAAASIATGGRALKALFAPLNLPGDAVVVIGTRAHERDWAEAARTARFLAAESYFSAH